MTPLTKTLLQHILWETIFQGTCDDSEMNPDLAVKRIEATASMLSGLPREVLDEFLALAREARERSNSPKVKRFLDDLARDLLEDAAAA